LIVEDFFVFVVFYSFAFERIADTSSIKHDDTYLLSLRNR